MAVKQVIQGQQAADLVTGRRAELLALADVDIFQADVIDTSSRRRNVIIWRCGTDVLYASTMDGLFDEGRRKPAPQWLKDQVDKLPSERRFKSNGDGYVDEEPQPRSSGRLPAPVPLGDNESLDEDVAGAQQA
jgi:hypothetical protein